MNNDWPLTVQNALTGLSATDAESLLGSGAIVDFSSGDWLIREGDTESSLLLLLKGRARVTQHYFGNDIELATRVAGDCIGEISLLDKSPASASVAATEDTAALQISRKKLDELVATDEKFGSRLLFALALVLAKRVREMSGFIPPLLGEDSPSIKDVRRTRTSTVDDNLVPAQVKEATAAFIQRMNELERLGRNSELTEQAINNSVVKENDQLQAALSGLARGADRFMVDTVGAYIFRETFPILMRSRFIERCYAKPRGYAGDYYTIYQMYQNSPQGDGALGKAIDRYALALPISEANRSRLHYVRDKVRGMLPKWRGDGPMPLTSLASGSALELSGLQLDDSSPGFSAVCIDIDPEAVRFAKNTATALGTDHRMHFALDNVIRMSRGRGQVKIPQQQFIYSLGLIDYLQDKIVVGLLDWMHDHLYPGGIAVLGNLHPENPQRTFMEQILDWHLLYRTEDDLRNIVAATKFRDAPVNVVVDDSKVQLYLECTKQ